MRYMIVKRQRLEEGTGRKKGGKIDKRRKTRKIGNVQ